MEDSFNLHKTIIALIVSIITIAPALAHQPFFEESDLSFYNAKYIQDPTISTAIYSTLETPDDVDYYSFNATENQSILLSITIPQIEGQENFTPIMALIGPGLQQGDLPINVLRPDGSGILILPPPLNATSFFEPFSRTSYWTRQEQYVRLPASGSYMVAVWDENRKVGRYVFVLGDREVPGGDLAFALKILDYWTAVNKPAANNSQMQAVPKDNQKGVSQALQNANHFLP